MRTKKGQALMIAVLLMTVILLVGAIFVAIVVYAQSQSTRHASIRQAKALADGGIQYVDRMLRTKTADWRPEDPPAWCSGEATPTFDSVEQIIEPNYSGNDEFDPGFWGPDGARQTEDDYYTVEELRRGWCAKRLGPALPGDANRPNDALGDPLYPDPTRLDEAGELVTRGFTRIPDPRRPEQAIPGLPVSVNKGHALIRVTYDPDPPFEGTPDEDRDGDGTVDYRDADPMSGMIRIESIGAVVDEGYAYRRLIAYKPLVLTDYLRNVTDRDGTGQPVFLGIPSWIDFDGSRSDPARTSADNLSEHVVTRFDGPLRINSRLYLVGEQLDPTSGAIASTQFGLTTQSGPDGTGVRNSSYLRTDTIEATNGIYYRDPVSDHQATVEINLDPTSPNPQTIWPSEHQGALSTDFKTYGSLTGTGSPAIVDGMKNLDGAGYSRFASPRRAPELFARDPETGHTMYDDLTRYTGPLQEITDTSGGSSYYVHAGEWCHGDAPYIDNVSDRQFTNAKGECDIQTLMDDWLRSISPTDARAGDSGWNATRTTYAPPGVEIWIVGAELPTYDPNTGEGVVVVQPDPRSPAMPPGTWWSPSHVTGEPQIVLRRHDHTWRTATGADSGQFTMVIDHPRRTSQIDPPRQVIYAAGNVRVKGVLPRRPTRPTPTSPQTEAGVFWPDYNLAVVSGGTAYIDGSILSPRDAGLVGATNADDDKNTKLAILARDCVCLNTTQIVPQDATPIVSAEPDDTDDPRPEASHWELTSEAGARVYSSFMFGAQPPADARVLLAAIMCGKEPGPSAVSMSFYQRWLAAPGWVPYVFNSALVVPTPPPPTPPEAYIFYFLQPGAAAAVNVSTALSPRYQPVPDATGSPSVPWDITSYLEPSGTQLRQGVWNDFAIAWANPGPGFGAGATSTWIRKWKILEDILLDPNDPTSARVPTPAVHCKVNALMYAERGCWFVIPGSGFATVQEIDQAVGPTGDNIDGVIDTADEQARARLFLRYNYDITVNGMVTENFAAPVDAVREWTDKWSYPNPKWATDADDPLPSITYTFDSSIRAARDYGLGGAGVTGGTPDVLRSTDSANLPRMPLLPVSPDLVYYGETQ